VSIFRDLVVDGPRPPPRDKARGNRSPTCARIVWKSPAACAAPHLPFFPAMLDGAEQQPAGARASSDRTAFFMNASVELPRPDGHRLADEPSSASSASESRPAGNFLDVPAWILTTTVVKRKGRLSARKEARASRPVVNVVFGIFRRGGSRAREPSPANSWAIGSPVAFDASADERDHARVHLMTTIPPIGPGFDRATECSTPPV